MPKKITPQVFILLYNDISGWLTRFEAWGALDVDVAAVLAVFIQNMFASDAGVVYKLESWYKINFINLYNSNDE